MHVPFSASDFINRAEAVYGERTGIVDEPAQPAPSLGAASMPRSREKVRFHCAAGCRNSGNTRTAKKPNSRTLELNRKSRRTSITSARPAVLIPIKKSTLAETRNTLLTRPRISRGVLR